LWEHPGNELELEQGTTTSKLFCGVDSIDWTNEEWKASLESIQKK